MTRKLISKFISRVPIRVFFPVVGSVLFVLLFATGVIGFMLFKFYSQWGQLTEEKAQIQIQADELRQTSDDLTRFTRQYVITEKKQHLENYRRILAIRDGAVARPLNYEGIYWDLSPQARKEFHPPQTPESLVHRFQNLPLTQHEISLLKESLDASDRLAEIEIEVFAIYNHADSTQEERQQAGKRLFDDHYISAKEGIMSPLDKLLRGLEVRYASDKNVIENRITTIFIIFAILQAIFAVILVIVLWFVRKKILRPIYHFMIDINKIKKNIPVKKRIFYHDEFGVLIKNFYSFKEQIDHNYKELETLSFTDPLTGLYNRHYFYQTVQQQLQIAARNKQKTSILIGDIDHFKPINDTHGHLIGDEALKHIASLIQKNVRESDTCARFGGEEFIILLNNSDVKNSVKIAQKICDSIRENPYHNNSLTLNITISIGVSEMKGVSSNNINESIHRADQALYIAKKEGRNRVCQNND